MTMDAQVFSYLPVGLIRDENLAFFFGGFTDINHRISVNETFLNRMEEYPVQRVFETVVMGRHRQPWGKQFANLAKDLRACK
jgi:hypothetical protein